MSLKVTTQHNWKHFSNYSKYHPDNTETKVGTKLLGPVEGPEPTVQFDDIERRNGAWGHRLCCDRAYGPSDTKMVTTRKSAVTQKVGQNGVPISMYAEAGMSQLKSGFYSPSLKEQSCAEFAKARAQMI